MKRPLLFILGVWMLGELAAVRMGFSLVPETSLDQAMEGVSSSVAVTVTGTVTKMARTKNGYSYQLSDNTVCLGDSARTTHQLLVFTDDITDLQIGNTVRADGGLSAFDTPGNPGQFDSDGYYRALGVDFRLNETGREVQDAHTDRLRQALWQLRCRLAASLGVAAGEDVGVFCSLFLGDRSALPEETRAWFDLGGISHILAISGLHVSLFGMALFHLLRRLLLPPLPSGLISGSAALCYVILTGAGTSSRRAVIMFLLFLAAQALGRTYDLLSALATAGLLLLWEYPLLLWQEGFQLSFLAMAGIGIAEPVLRDWLDGGGVLTGSLTFSLSIQLATLPVLAWHEGTWAAYGILLNLIVIPLSGPLLALTAASSLLGCLWTAGAALVLVPARLILRLFEGLCRTAEKLPGHTLVLGQPARGQLVLYGVLLAAGLLFLRHRTRLREAAEPDETGMGSSSRLRRTAPAGYFPQQSLPVLRRGSLVLLFSLLLLVCLHRLPFSGTQITFLDVGQGDCNFIRCENRCCLIDGGSSSVSDVGTNRILPYLRMQGVTRLDAVFVTHGDSDHVNGLPAVLADSSLTVSALYLTPASVGDDTLEELVRTAQERGIPVRVIRAGDAWTWGEAEFLCEFPGEEDCAALAGDENNASLVLSLREADFSVLFTGDLGEAGETRWLSERDDSGGYTVLKAGHHGSKTSSGTEFLTAVRPLITVISCGVNNRYGHPAPETLERLDQIGSAVYTTPSCGAVTLTFRGGILRLAAFRR